MEKVFEEEFVLHNVNKCSMCCTTGLEPYPVALVKEADDHTYENAYFPRK